jgi:hypothetical protein
VSARRRRDGERGFVLFLSLLVLLVLTISAIGLMFSTSTERSLADTETRISKTFYAAEAGVEWSAAKFQSDPGFTGGTMPGGLSTNIPNAPAGDITVVVQKPVLLGYAVREKDELQTLGGSYDSNQVVEGLYLVDSTATSTAIQSKKEITAQLSVYPQQMLLP